ncbi:MAG: hypothetical protein WC954_01150 [Sphaerochaeta sp.]
MNFNNGITVIFLYPKGIFDPTQAIKKHIALLQTIEPLPVVLVLPSITRQRRESLINARIPFIVPNTQIYLPFLGILLQERFAPKEVESFSLQPATQVLLFCYLYRKESKLYLQEVSESLPYSKMTLSRAFDQLAQTGHIIAEKDGVQRFLYSPLQGRELFERMRPYLINPVRKRGYLHKEELTQNLLLAGDSALALQSMINSPIVPSYATVHASNITEVLIDTERQVGIEVWKYDPSILTSDLSVDPLSLIMSYTAQDDERITKALESILAQL